MSRLYHLLSYGSAVRVPSRQVRYPAERFHFVGVDPPGLAPEVRAGERARSARPFEADPYGCHDAELKAKRAERNPFRRAISYPIGCPELSPLISRCPEAPYEGPLPWDAT